MKVRDLLPMDIDIDVYDNVCEELGICFCGPAELTDEGARYFADVLDYDIDLCRGYGDVVAIVHVDDPDDKVWRHKLNRASALFYALAGYCSDKNYHRWFKDE